MSNQQFKIEIQTYSKEILTDMFGKDAMQLADGDTQKIEDTDSEIEIVDYSPTESFGLAELFTVMLTITTGITTRLIAAWLTEKLKSKKDVIAITVNGKSISTKDFSEEKLIALLQVMSDQEK